MNKLFKKLNGIPCVTSLPSSPLSLYKGGGVLKTAVYPETVAHLHRLADALSSDNGSEYAVIGGFSNTLVADGGYGGVAVMTSNFRGIFCENGVISAGAGERLPYIASAAWKNGLSGLEKLYGIPASFGGAVVMNAGAYGSCLSDIIESVTAYDLKSGRIVRYNKDDIRWDYRSSGGAFRNKVVICASLRLTPDEKNDIRDKMLALKKLRTSAQPNEPSLGCVFRNPESGVSAGYYIDKAGMKGTRLGGAKISEKHANFIVNTGGGTADDYIGLLNAAKKKVYLEYGELLKREVIIIGGHSEFDN